MADSIDRVFVHALNTLKRIPKTGAPRPPAADRLRLYGLYKQAREGDVAHIMPRPLLAAQPISSNGAAGVPDEERQRERDKWDAWSTQAGLSATEAKRRYIETLIETMREYATTPDARELAAELEFVWGQIRDNSPEPDSSGNVAVDPTGHLVDGQPLEEEPALSRSQAQALLDNYSITDGGSGASNAIPCRSFRPPLSGADGPMRVLSPMSEQDEADMAAAAQEAQRVDDKVAANPTRTGGNTPAVTERWKGKVELALIKLSAEIAALREQITTGREWRARKDRSLAMWARWIIWTVAKHVFVNVVVLGLVLLYLRRAKDGRLEDLVRTAFGLGREYMRAMLPSRSKSS